MIPVHRDLGLLIIYCYFRNCVYMETGTSSLTWSRGWSNWDPDQAAPMLVHISAISWYTLGWSELKFKTLADTGQNLQKRKQKETKFVGMLFIYMRTKFVFFLSTNYYQLFTDFVDEIDTSRSPGKCIHLGQPRHPGTPGLYKQAHNIW